MTRIALAGFGTVGQGVWQILQDQDGRLGKAPGGAPEIAAILVRGASKPRDAAPATALLTEDAQALLATPGLQVLMEATGDTALGYELVTRAMRSGMHVITASKALVSAHMEELHALAQEQGVQFLYEASVGGGIPLIKPLKDLPWLGEVTALRGIINGSCNYILDAMTRDGRTFEQVVHQARQLGYLEADADADLLGWDAQRKLRILATLAFGGTIREQDIPCEGISRITHADISTLKERGLTVKLLGTASKTGDAVSATIFPHALANEDVLAGIGGAYNYVEAQGDYMDRVGFFGSGAGRFPTAHAMVNDLVDVLLHRQPTSSPIGTAALQPTRGSETASFYLRDVPKQHVPEKEAWGAGVLSHPMSIREVIALLERHPQAAAIVVPQGS